ncbi:unnamed protein product [Ectocarpus fasciculatus]
MRFPSSSGCPLTVLLAVALCLHEGQAFVPSVLTSSRIAAKTSSPLHAPGKTHGRSSRRGAGRGGGLKMGVQTPPKPKKPEFAEGRVADEELLSVIELAGRKAAAAGFLPVLGAKAKEEQDIMWKLKVSPEDVLAFADRTIDSVEDVFMHATRAFKPAARMNLPLQDGEDKPPLTATKKERIVVLGTGWGGHAISKVIDSDKYEVIYVSPRNYFVFTPMLAAASVGTVDVRSITEPIRMANPCVKYVSGEVIDINPGDKKVVVALPSPQEKRPPQKLESAASVAPNLPPLVHSKGPAEGATAATGGALSQAGEGSLSQEPLGSLDEAKPLMELSYDKLVYAVGTKTGTFGVPGVRENCYMLKEANDARLLRAAIVNVLEEACLPGVTDEEKRRLLSFVVIGAGPTGVEFTGELTDLIGNDVPRLFPELVGLINLTVVSSGKVLPMFEEVLQDRGLNLLQSQGIEILLGSAASEVTEEEVVLKNGKRIPYGLCFWAGGTEARPLTQRLIETIGSEQKDASGSKRGQITVDGYMRAVGTNGTILALGDASSIQGVKMPTTGQQVAAQEGAYVARLLNRGYDTSVEEAPTMTGYDNSTAGLTEKAADFFRLRGRLSASPFHFINLGVLAYIGMGQAVAEVKVGKDTPVLDAAGKAGFFLWRSTYVVKQARVSPRNRINVAVDWLKVRFFGRDITRL